MFSTQDKISKKFEKAKCQQGRFVGSVELELSRGVFQEEVANPICRSRAKQMWERACSRLQSHIQQ
jgi:hypothetical protein